MQRFYRSRTPSMQDNLARMLNGLEFNRNSLMYRDHPRWWEYPIGPPTPVPINVKYACDEALGRPSVANCEAALYEFVQSGDVMLDPELGPIIKVIGISSSIVLVFRAVLIFDPTGRKLCHSCWIKRKAFHNLGHASKCSRDFDRDMHKQPSIQFSWRYSHQSDEPWSEKEPSL